MSKLEAGRRAERRADSGRHRAWLREVERVLVFSADWRLSFPRLTPISPCALWETPFTWDNQVCLFISNKIIQGIDLNLGSATYWFFHSWASYFCSLCPELPLPWAGRECQTQYRGLGGSANSLDYSEIPVTKYCSASVEHRLGHDDIFILPYLVIIYPLHVKSINVTSSRCFWMDIWQVKDKSWIYRGGIENLLCKRGLMGSEKSRSHSE